MVLYHLRRLFRKQPEQQSRQVVADAPRLVLSRSCFSSFRDALLPDIRRRHEGVLYLYGLASGSATLILGAIRPAAITGPGSFEVSAIAMAKVIRTVSDFGLHVVGQLHTHPSLAYHSEGDEEGARIAYEGFVSIVIPDYGVHLPSMRGAAIYRFREGRFQQLPNDAVGIAPEGLATC